MICLDFIQVQPHNCDITHTHTHTHMNVPNYYNQEFLDGEKRNNEEKDKSLAVMERTAAKTRLAYQEAETDRLAFRNEVCELPLFI